MNRLANELSPYLQLHKDDPVDWHPWGPEAFAAAREANKPILLSVGFNACHWCHMMQQESFKDPETSAQMNESFVCIMVDKEDRPDVDMLYQAAANLMGHASGWPLNIFLTPEQIPYGVGTYFPKEARTGQVPFRTVLTEVAATYHDRKDEVAQATANLTRELTTLFYRDMRGPLDASSLDSAAFRIAQRFDIFFGGLTGQLKFPTATLLEVLWRAFLRTGLTPFLQLLSTTLDHMVLGGLYDHVGGGFARYAQDERWTVPHWEKMLFDQGQILEIMTAVWQFNRNKVCEVRVAETVEFLLRDMRAGQAFAASISSDSEGEEGKYFMWSEAEIDAALMGTFSAKFKTAYNITRDGNFPGGRNILHRLGAPSPYPQSDADEALFTKQRQLLFAARRKRVAPFRDEKIMADWNGIAIAALAEAAAVFERSDWMKAAVEAFDFVVKAMGDGDRLHHDWIDGKRNPLGFADDYAQMARAALLLYEHLGDPRYLEHARTWVRTLNERHWDAEKGGYCVVADDADPLIMRARAINDNPTPSTNGTMLSVLARLAMATGDPQYRDRANALIGTFAGEAMRVFTACGAYFNGLEFALTDLNLVVIGPPSHPRTHELKMAVLGRALPNRFLMVRAPDEAFPLSHPMHDKGMQDGQPTAYVVQRGQVSPPITNPVALSQMLQLPQQRRAPAVQQ